jgi:PHD/YefM family antitoxin component YafN of YafNO toxin-antitoxin module
VAITQKRGNTVLIAEEDWMSTQETLYLMSLPGIRKSIKEGLDTPVDECEEDIEW